ncbi:MULTISPECIES: flagellar motor switch protein FliM [unclassified Nitrosomonas]|uniref:flagellar motor switch protein FliM n=1 Tax=unclassified Nitrosomonas TaxID=2609265 RepID=UPI001D82C1D5|nr:MULTISPECIES: flagellar motor switch protein FliM [unclassified Nitrosomonas]MBX9893842.1 flagellar motor switch protein FliM [Nitrosomonas sp.]MCC7090663.1 flagellar motor switch protein FliM [Nitrosomonas sp.]WMJ08498.1 flagellar motor switch protein FliM [Nitrosomonas sp. sh817]
MSEDFLSQEEVDALLKGATGDSDEAQEEEDKGGVRPYNIATQERIVRGRMPTYEIINERFARLLRIGLFNFMRRTVDIAVGPVKVIKFSEFVRNLVVPTNLNMVHMKPLRGTALLVFDPDLIFLIVDNLFGGDGRYHTRVEGRDFTQTEQRIIQRLLDVVFEEYEKSWKSVYPVNFEYIRSEMNPQFATIATPNEVVVAVTFDIDMGNKGGGLHVCIPYSMVEPIRDILYSALQGDHMEVDKRWIKLMSQQVQGAEVELVANLGHTKVTFEQILSMQVGDIIPLEIPKTITVNVSGVPVLDCRYGTMNGRYALKVNTLISQSETEN